MRLVYLKLVVFGKSSSSSEDLNRINVVFPLSVTAAQASIISSLETIILSYCSWRANKLSKYPSNILGLQSQHISSADEFLSSEVQLK